MMDWIREWAFSICITLIAISLFSMLMPKGSMEKTAKFTISLFFLSCLIGPFIFNPPSFSLFTNFSNKNIKDNLNYEIVKTVHNQVVVSIENVIRKNITETLKKNNINIKKIEININISDDNSILINRIDIFLDSSYKMMDNQIRNIIKKEVEIEPSIIYD